MKRQLLTDIELDVQELKCLADSFSKTPTTVFRELMTRNVLQMRGRLDELLEELSANCGVASSDNKESVACYVTDDPLPISCELEVETESVVKEKKDLICNAVFGDRIMPAVDLRHSISLNDSFRFTREIFGGDNELMNRVVGQISAMNSYHAAIAFLSSKAKLEEGEENEAMNDFLELLKKYFNQPA